MCVCLCVCVSVCEVDAALNLSHMQNIGQMIRSHFKTLTGRCSSVCVCLCEYQNIGHMITSNTPRSVFVCVFQFYKDMVNVNVLSCVMVRK